MRCSCWSRKRVRRAPHAPCFHVRSWSLPVNGNSSTIERTMWPAQGASQGCQRYDRGVSAARMGAAIDLQEPLAVDAGIDLRGRERGVAEQFLDRAKVAAAGQQMRGKGVPERMRGGAVGQAECAAQPLHRELDDARAQGPAARADEHGSVW